MIWMEGIKCCVWLQGRTRTPKGKSSSTPRSWISSTLQNRTPECIQLVRWQCFRVFGSWQVHAGIFPQLAPQHCRCLSRLGPAKFGTVLLIIPVRGFRSPSRPSCPLLFPCSLWCVYSSCKACPHSVRPLTLFLCWIWTWRKEMLIESSLYSWFLWIDWLFL